MDEFEKWLMVMIDKAVAYGGKQERAKIVAKLRKDGKTSDGAEAWYNNIADRIEGSK